MQIRAFTNELFLVFCAQLAFLCIVLFNDCNTYSRPPNTGCILWIQDVTPSPTVASFIYFISVIKHFKLFPFGSYFCCNESRLCDLGISIVLNQGCPGTNTKW